MRAQNDPLVWFLTSADFGDHIVHRYGTRGDVVKFKLNDNRALFEFAANQLGVLHAYFRFG